MRHNISLTLSILALLTFGVSAVSHAQTSETVTVDFATSRGTPTYKASGLLHGVDPGTEPSSIITPLKLQLIRDSTYYLNTLYSGLTSLGVKTFQGILFGRPSAFDSTHNPTWSQWINSSVSGAKAAGQSPQWDLLNEPDNPGYWGNTSQAQMFAWWKQVYLAVRAADPNAIIVGPSITGFYSLTGPTSWMQDFLTYARDNNVLPDILSWHDMMDSSLNDPSVIAAHVTAAKNLLTSLGIAQRPMSINEYTNAGILYDPGTLAGALASIDRIPEIVSAAHSCWNDVTSTGAAIDDCSTTSMVGIVVPDTLQPRATWWVYKGYADITGQLVRLTPSATVDGVAGYDAGARTARLILGRRGGSGDVSVNFSNVSSAPNIIVNGQVRVIAQRIPNNGPQPVSSPQQVFDQNVPVVNNTLSVSLPFGSGNDAFILLLGPGSSGGSGMNSGTNTDTGCSAFTPQPSGTVAPCAVLSVSTGSVAKGNTETITMNKTGSYIFNTVYVSEYECDIANNCSYQWVPFSFSAGAGNFLLGTASLSLDTTNLTVGTHYILAWEWTKVGTCYAGPGTATCNQGSWRIQKFTVF